MRERIRFPERVPASARLVAVAIGLVAVALAVRTTATSLEWIGRTFPGFMVIQNRVVARIGLPNWSSAAAPELFLSEVVAVDGRPLADAAELRELVSRLPPGAIVDYRVLRRGRERTLSVPTQHFGALDWAMLFGAYLLNGVVFLGAGLLAWSLRPRSPLTRAFLAFDASAALFLFTAMDLYGPSTFFDLHLLSEALVPAAALQLLLLFPEEHRLARWRFAGYPVALVLFALLEREAGRPQAFLRVFEACSLFLAATALLFGLRQTHEFWRATSPAARQRVRLVTLGTLFGLALPGVIILVSLAAGGSLGMNTIVFTFFLFPVALAYAIVKHDLFEIDAMVKRGAYYLLLTGTVGLAYAGGIFLLNFGLQGSEVTRTPVFLAAFTVAILLLFNALRARLQAFVDRVFFRTRYDGAQVLAAVGTDLASALRHEEISRLVRDAVAQAIPNVGTELFFDRDGRGELREVASGALLPAVLGGELGAGRILTADDPPELYADRAAHRAVAEALRARGAEVAVPMRLHDRVVGLLLVGAKRSGLFFTADDAGFLLALAQQAAIALQNATSYEALVELNAELESRVRERTAKLRSANSELATSNAALEHALAELKGTEVKLVQSAKMASLGRLAAGVAHEINNPVSFIASNLEPLRSRIEKARAAEPEQAERLLAQARELIGIMAKGAARTVAVVNDLRSFSRLNEAPRKAVDLREGLDVTIRLLETRWRERIAIHRDYAEVPEVECEAGQINQVFMNLLANACDAIRDEGEIHVAVGREGDSVVVSIRDTGCGIAPESVERIFDPFFTTKDVGAGTGLGLAIAHGIVAAHGGRIAVESEPGAGSTFRVFLPIAAPRAATAPAPSS